MSVAATSKRSATREWTPRLWEGCDLFAWLRILLKNRGAVHPRYLYIAFIITFISLCNTALRLLQNAWFVGKPERTRLKHAPIFIIGHWRSGTTLLHELLILDPHHSFANTCQCLAPQHFLLTEPMIKRFFSWILPTHRPMDNMLAGWDRPQEDEFALCMMGQPSPYWTIAFPNHGPQDPAALDLEHLPRRALLSWKRAFLGFLGRLTYRDPRRLILKSPTHSCRIPTLLELFPEAKFVHIVRDPYVVFPSTINLWKTLYERQGLQVPTFDGLDTQVFDTFRHMHERIVLGKRLLLAGQFHELRYEDLIADPESQLRLLYERLQLGDFDAVRPAIARFWSEQRSYQTNRYQPLTPELERKITSRWGDIITSHGYALRAPSPAEIAG